MAQDNIAFIRDNVPMQERLTALAEEATELAQAALKYRRTLIKGNPTPVDRENAKRALLEEIADVECCNIALDLPPADWMCIGKILKRKAQRWANRLKEAK